MRAITLRGLALLTVASLVPACGGSSGGGGGTSPTISTAGGAANGSSDPGTTTGGNAGSLQIRSLTAIRFGVNPPPGRPTLPPTPSGAANIDDLSADVVIENGDGFLTGTVTGSGAATRTITVEKGDLVVSGTLLGGQNAGAQINLQLEAPSGTVYITGVVRTTSLDGIEDGDNAGTVEIYAQRIVVTGLIEARGEKGAVGGHGAAIVLATQPVPAGTDILIVGGTLDSTGGVGTAFGGNGGILILAAQTEVRIHSLLRADGGAAEGTVTNVVAGTGGNIVIEGPTAVSTDAASEIRSVGGRATTTQQGANGGDGGDVRINDLGSESGPVLLYGSLNVAGGAGSATATLGSPVSGGDGGVVQIGHLIDHTDSPISIDLATADLDARGGTSTDYPGLGPDILAISSGYGSLTLRGRIDASAGTGGNGNTDDDADISLQTLQGDILLEGTLRADGASGALAAGPPQQISLLVKDRGSILVTGTIEANGGSATGNGDVAGGGVVAQNCAFLNESATGSIRFEAGSVFRNNGGRASGAGAGGDAGFPTFETQAGRIYLAGTFQANGGDSPGGTGGLGGSFWILSDGDAAGASDGIGGDITIAPTGTIDANGGAGAVGGNALLAYALRLDADGNNSNDVANNGVVLNLGRITARGGSGSPGGGGGGVFFDGLNAGLTAGPAPGVQDRSAAPGGLFNGSFVSQ